MVKLSSFKGKTKDRNLVGKLKNKMVLHHIGVCCSPVTGKIEDSNSFSTAYSFLAQLVVQLTCNQQVNSSSLLERSIMGVHVLRHSEFDLQSDCSGFNSPPSPHKQNKRWWLRRTLPMFRIEFDSLILLR